MRVSAKLDENSQYTSSLIRRQEQAHASLRQQLPPHISSRPSSSSGSTRSIRRVPRIQGLGQPAASRLRSSSLDSNTLPSSSPPRAAVAKPTFHRRAASAHYSTTTPHPALRISRRTHSAILYALEEAIRKPHPFTVDEIEENAQMSDLAGGSTARASNGGARTGGPVPVGGGTGGTPIRTPRDIMKDRNERERRRQEEEQRRLAEERRRSAERRAATVQGAAPRFSQSSSQYSPDVSAPQAGFEGAGVERRDSRRAGEVAGSNVLGDPTGRASQEPPRTRGPSVSQPQQPQPRPAPAAATAAAPRRTQPSQQAPRQPQPSASTPAQPGPSAQPSAAATTPAGDGSQRGTSSSFPHAFERWETLSSHWEGLTSYWLHKLEQNTEEIRETVPNASTLNRQITDLSAAGANLFHAVVELQRLRASSERKFQRWFFETRADNERNREVQAGLERQLKAERQAREESARTHGDNAIAIENAKREVSEMRRELMISKDEARRAWEELGRRNQESLDTAQSLKEGRVTLVSGVQVVPYFGGPASRGTGSISQGQQRPVTRDGTSGYGGTGMASAAAAAGLQSPGDERQYYREEAASPTNTDPFTDSGRQQQMHQSPGTQSLAQGTYYPQNYPQGGTPASAATASTVIPATSQFQQSAGSPSQARAGQPSVSSSEAQRFYQHGGQGTQLLPQQAAQTAPVAREDVRSEARSEVSYVDTLSEGDTEYAIDAGGNIRHDEQGRPIVFRRRGPARSSESEDDFDTEEAVRRERELAARYGSQLIPEAPSVPSTSAQAMATFTPTSAEDATSSGAPDYEGEGYEGYQQYVPRHHHPTRLSDVLEEEEERSSRRTGGD
ncbi:hypothetical protein M409DRAFT_64153 [Zasmidium cellare ATCC 36951]|uniref:Uncharacterized protein n=1 Tax=Zasmidium cellare ATCC 36951 TaxID=1080233 RepID=A0A6A6CX73_ZASCE|nr:uncharacterized protein M409DRAFT_64153 [Zasmidium cellare ATCC 36951]KAF2170399.1 hypothetical protein M409DRAFT_64153 [Zasmidium cellare ATCC 36951]